MTKSGGGDRDGDDAEWDEGGVGDGGGWSLLLMNDVMSASTRAVGPVAPRWCGAVTERPHPLKMEV